MSTILIADDEARIRRLVSDFLKRDGHTILEAADGKAALELIENRRPTLDLAILDVMMPGMDGFEVLRELERGRGQRQQRGARKQQECFFHDKCLLSRRDADVSVSSSDLDAARAGKFRNSKDFFRNIHA